VSSTLAGWTNWSGSVACRARRVESPPDEAAVAALVRAAAADGLVVRAAGAGHSFVPVCASDGVVVLTEGLHGLIAADPAAGVATVGGGSRIWQLGPLLHAAGVGMITMGDIDRQSVAGAVATGTHGSGPTLGSISTQVAGLRLVTAEGEVVGCSPAREPELFACARVSLGVLGLVTAVTLRVLPRYRLRERTWPCPLDDALAQLDTLVPANRHFEFFWRPRTDLCDMKSLNFTDHDPAGEGPPEAAARTGWSHEIIPSERNVKFNEIEFAVPAARGPDCLREIRACMRARHPDVAWPLEYRTLAPDDIPLSPAHGRPTVTISAHEAAERPHEPFFRDVEAIFRNHRGRPHWGKWHTHRAAELRALYPQWDRFRALRERMDPAGRFLNDHLRGVLVDD
jgi:FAD/FMN-containing dehydrogenase